MHYLGTPAPLPLDGGHADAAVVAGEAAAPRCRPRLRLPRPRHDSHGRLVPRPRRSRTCSSRSGCSAPGCARSVSSGRSTPRSTAASPRARRRSPSPRSSRPRTSSPPGIPRDRIVVRGNGFPDPDADARRDRTVCAPCSASRRRAGRALRRPHRRRQGRRAPSRRRPPAGVDSRRPRRPGRPARHDGRRARSRRPHRRRRGRVHVLPPEPDPPLWLYAEADVFVLASAGDSFGLVAAEAAAAGTPVIVTDRAGVAGSFRETEARRRPRRSRCRRRRHRAGCWATRPLREQLSEGGRNAARRHVVGPRDRACRRRSTARPPRAPPPRTRRPTARSPSRARARATARPRRAGRRRPRRASPARPPPRRRRRPGRGCRSHRRGADRGSPDRSESTSGSPQAAASLTTTPQVSRSERSANTSAAT